MADATLTRPPAIPVVPADEGNLRVTTVRIAAALNKAIRGGISATMGVTLAPSATSSTFYDSRIGAFTFIALMPTTAHAAEVLASIWIVTGDGVATIHHTSVTYIDCTYVACLLG